MVVGRLGGRVQNSVQASADSLLHVAALNGKSVQPARLQTTLDVSRTAGLDSETHYACILAQSC